MKGADTESGELPVRPDTTEALRFDPAGWPLDDKERRDFLHRIRSFPPSVAEWRKHLVQKVLADRERFPKLPAKASAERIRELVDEGITFVRELARLLALLHGNPDLGNKSDPLDELIYIILSRKTREGAYQSAYDLLKTRFKTWDELLQTSPSEVEDLIRSSGLAEKKTISLFGVLERIREKFGTCTLEPIRAWSDEKIESFLTSLPEIQRKTAYCVMMYALHREVLPVDTHVGRVLARIGIFRELGLELPESDHKKLQVLLADLVPPNLRYSMHVNLVQHGREVCLAVNPRCDSCQLRNFCKKFRADEVDRSTETDVPVAVDLFCGAGGMSTGFRRAGYKIAASLDADPVALKTYSLNHPEVPDSRVLCRDITTLKSGELRKLVGAKVDIVIGAPPCQGFSMAGKRSKSTKLDYVFREDARNFLFENVVKAVLELKPRMVLMENVPGMNSARSHHGPTFLELAAKQLADAGYETDTWRLNASAFGVPQDRIRVFLVAARGVPLPARPQEDYQDIHKQDFDVDALPPVTLQEAIFDLPARAANDGEVVERWEQQPTNDPRMRRYLSRRKLTDSPDLLFNHTVRYHNERDLELYGLLRPGEDSIHVIERHKRPDLMRYRRDVFDDKYARLRPDRPSKTIVSHLAKDGNGYIHPYQVRSITLREAARIQSFPDSYIFCGSPSDQWVHLGNAVPPVLAEAIALTFKRVLDGGKR